MKKLYLIFMAAVTMFAVMSCANPASGGGIDNNFLPDQPRWSSIEDYAETHTIDMRGHGEKSKAYELDSNIKILVQKGVDVSSFQEIVKSHMKDESIFFYVPHEKTPIYFKKPNGQELMLYVLPVNPVYEFSSGSIRDCFFNDTEDYRKYNLYGDTEVFGVNNYTL